MMSFCESQFPSRSKLEFHCRDSLSCHGIDISHYHFLCFFSFCINSEHCIHIAYMERCTGIKQPIWIFGHRDHVKFNDYANLYFRNITIFSFTSLPLYSLFEPLLLSSSYLYSYTYIQEWNDISCHSCKSFIHSIAKTPGFLEYFLPRILILEPFSFQSKIPTTFGFFIFNIIYFLYYFWICFKMKSFLAWRSFFL